MVADPAVIVPPEQLSPNILTFTVNYLSLQLMVGLKLIESGDWVNYYVHSFQDSQAVRDEFVNNVPDRNNDSEAEPVRLESIEQLDNDTMICSLNRANTTIPSIQLINDEFVKYASSIFLESPYTEPPPEAFKHMVELLIFSYFIDSDRRATCSKSNAVK